MSSFDKQEYDDAGNLVRDPDDPLAAVKKAVKDAGSDEKIPARVAEAVEAVARSGMDAGTRAAIRAWLKREKHITVLEFDQIVKDVRRGSRRTSSALSPLHPENRRAHLQIWPSWAY